MSFSILGLTKYKLFKIITNIRFWVAIIFSIIYTNSYTYTVVEFAQENGISVSTWLLPFLFDYQYTITIYGIVIVLLFCDAPFIEENEAYLLLRTKRSLWFKAQICYTLSLSFIYTISLFIVSIMVVIFNIEFTSSWGKAIQTVANTYPEGINIGFNLRIISEYSPVEATFFSMLFFFLACFVIATIIFTINLYTNRYVGSALCISFSLLVIFVQNTTNFTLLFLSPLSWARLTFVDFDYKTNFPTPMYIITVSIIVSSIFWTIAYLKFRKSDINPQKGI